MSICNPCIAATSFEESCVFRAPGGNSPTIYFAHACEIDTVTLDSYNNNIVTNITMQATKYFRRITAQQGTVGFDTTQLDASGALETQLNFQIGVFASASILEDAYQEAVTFFKEMAYAKNEFIFIVTNRAGVRVMLGYAGAGQSDIGMSLIKGNTAGTSGLERGDAAQKTLNFIGGDVERALAADVVIPVS